MEENNVMDTNIAEEVDFFADDTEDTTPETDEVETDTKETTEEKAQEQQDNKSPVTIKGIKFLDKDLEVSEAEAIPLIQKGLNYDHVKAEFDRLKAENETLRKQTQAKEAEKQVSEMVDKGYDEEYAKEFVALKQYKAEMEAKEAERQTETTAESKRETNLKDFIAEYPDVAPKDWSEAMREAYAKGENIAEIYRKEENTRLKAEIEALKTNSKNKEKAVGNVNTNNKPNKVDDFEAGLFG